MQKKFGGGLPDQAATQNCNEAPDYIEPVTID